jgi:hypothetical protein
MASGAGAGNAPISAARNAGGAARAFLKKYESPDKRRSRFPG